MLGIPFDESATKAATLYFPTLVTSGKRRRQVEVSNDGDTNNTTTGTTSAKLVDLVKALAKHIIDLEQRIDQKAAITTLTLSTITLSAITLSAITLSAITLSYTIAQQLAIEESNMTATSPIDLEDDNNGSAKAIGSEGKATIILVVKVDKSDTSDS